MKQKCLLTNLLHSMGDTEWGRDKAADIESALRKEIPDMDTAEITRRSIRKPADEIVDGERAVIKWVSTRDVDRYNEILVPGGVVLTEYLLSPVVLLNHNYAELPIGIDEWIKADNYGVKAKVRYADTERAEEVYQLNKQGIMNASSVGFYPLEYVERGASGWDDLTKKLGADWGEKPGYFKNVSLIYTKWVLVEHSDVSVPANPHALNIMVGKGFQAYDDELQPISESVGGPGVVLKFKCDRCPRVQAWFGSDPPESHLRQMEARVCQHCEAGEPFPSVRTIVEPANVSRIAVGRVSVARCGVHREGHVKELVREELLRRQGRV